jgi:hypothetical protein
LIGSSVRKGALSVAFKSVFGRAGGLVATTKVVVAKVHGSIREKIIHVIEAIVSKVHFIQRCVIIPKVQFQVVAVVEFSSVTEEILFDWTRRGGVSTNFHGRVISKRQFIVAKVEINQRRIFKASGFLGNRTAEATVGEKLASKVHTAGLLFSWLQVKSLRKK